MDSMHDFFFGNKEEPHDESLTEFTKRVGLFRGTWYVPVLTAFLVETKYYQWREKKLSTGFFSRHLTLTYFCTLGGLHLLGYLLHGKENPILHPSRETPKKPLEEAVLKKDV